VTPLARKTPVRTFPTVAGRVWLVRVLPVGARYGRTGGLVVANGPMVEFYDTRHADDGAGPGADDGFGPLGQFVSRYYGGTLLGRDGYGSGEGPLCLDTGSPAWTVDATMMSAVRRWLRATLPTCAGEFTLPGEVLGGQPWVCTRDPDHGGPHAHHDDSGHVVAIEGQEFSRGGQYDHSVLRPRLSNL
jgi:hypothetical protein